jgi:hypothetical protein
MSTPQIRGAAGLIFVISSRCWFSRLDLICAPVRSIQPLYFARYKILFFFTEAFCFFSADLCLRSLISLG